MWNVIEHNVKYELIIWRSTRIRAKICRICIGYVWWRWIKAEQIGARVSAFWIWWIFFFVFIRLLLSVMFFSSKFVGSCFFFNRSSVCCCICGSRWNSFGIVYFVLVSYIGMSDFALHHSEGTTCSSNAKARSLAGPDKSNRKNSE